MNQLNMKILVASVALALGTATTAWAEQTNNATDAEIEGNSTQSATATSTLGGNTSPQANENSSAWQEDHSDNSDHSDHSDNSDHSDHSYADAEDYGISANGGGSATNSSSASATDAAANNGSTANSDRSDHSMAGVHGTGAAANGGGNATFTDNTDNSSASANGNYSAAANNQATAEVHVAVSESTLTGTVTGNTTTFTPGLGLVGLQYNGNNDAGGAVAGASGVINFSQNTGQNALTQQSVSTQASLTVN